MITDHALTASIEGAKYFIVVAEQLQHVRQQPGRTIISLSGAAAHTYPVSQVKEHAAVKRASMDLSRKLADLRMSR